jgi:hypothetical protein
VWRRAESAAGEPVRRASTVPQRRLGFGQGGCKHAVGQAPLLWLARRNLIQPPWLKPVRVLALVFLGLMLLASVGTRHWEQGFIAAFCTVYALHALTRVQFALAATRWWNEDKRSRALEAILVTPVSDHELFRAHHDSLLQAFRRPLLGLVLLNIALQMTVVIYLDHLHLRGGPWSIFTVFFVGGVLITAADFAAMRWLSLKESLRCPTQLKAAGAVLGWLCGGAWIAFACAFLVALNFHRAEEAARVFAFWVLACLCYDAALICRCRQWLRRGIRGCLQDRD